MQLLLSLVILIEGFVSISAEILAIRQLLPVAGGSVIVTSLIIGIFLLFLAWGYSKGGRVHVDPRKVLKVNFFIAAIWLGIGFSYFFISLFFYSLQTIIGSHLIYPLIAYLLLVLAPLVFILGQTVPIIMNMEKQNRSAGIIAGNTLALSTLGSFLGAILTTLFLMQYLGVAWSIFINCILLILLGMTFERDLPSLLYYCIIAFLVSCVIYICNITIENRLALKTNAYSNYQILDSQSYKLVPGEKVLMLNEAASSYINNEKKGFPYIEIIKKILFEDMKLEHANILILGAGGFSLTAKNYYNNHITYVDVDSQIKKMVIPQFINKINGNLIVDDARHFLISDSHLYQAIVMDTYSDIKAIPAHLLTYEYMTQIKKHLTKTGVAIFNIIANPFLSDPYSKRIHNTIRLVFSNCMIMPSVYAASPTNIIYVCNTLNHLDKTFYSDNLNTSTTDSFNW